MVFFIDDMFLRALGLSLPPFDMVWVMERLHDYASQTMAQENLQKINDSIKEKRLLYELGEMTREEYEAAAEKLNNQRKIVNQENRTNLRYRINILGR